MFEYRGRTIIAEPEDVMERLRGQLADKGINLLQRGFKKSGDNLMFCCPRPHGADGHLERKPSCGIRTVSAPGHIAGTVHCFSCGWTCSIDEFVSYCFGFEDDQGRFGRKWIEQNFNQQGEQERPRLALDPSRKTRVSEADKFIDDKYLERFWKYHPYMFKRKMTKEVLDRFDVGFDEETQSITFPVKDKDGRCLFIARRSVKTKFFKYPEGVEKPVYGLQQIYEDTPKDVYVCESFFNALTCYVYGRHAVALMGLGTQYQYKQLLRMPARRLIIALDPDDQGNAAAMKMYRALGRDKLMCRMVIPRGKDINDLTREEFDACPLISCEDM